MRAFSAPGHTRPVAGGWGRFGDGFRRLGGAGRGVHSRLGGRGVGGFPLHTYLILFEIGRESMALAAA